MKREIPQSVQTFLLQLVTTTGGALSEGYGDELKR